MRLFLLLTGVISLAVIVTARPQDLISQNSFPLKVHIFILNLIQNINKLKKNSIFRHTGTMKRKKETFSQLEHHVMIVQQSKK